MTVVAYIWAAGFVLAWPCLTAFFGPPFDSWLDAAGVIAGAFVVALMWPALALVGLLDLARWALRRNAREATP
jgi:hypothetical protein